MSYIASISYGKDSLKMLDVIKSRGLPLDRIVTFDVWATDDIPAEFPEVTAFKKKMDANKKGKKSKKDEENKGGGFTIDMGMIGGFMKMMGSFTVLRLTSMISMANISFNKEELLDMNKKLIKIRKPKKLRNK